MEVYWLVMVVQVMVVQVGRQRRTSSTSAISICARNVNKPHATRRGRPSLAHRRITPPYCVRAYDQRVVMPAPPG